MDLRIFLAVVTVLLGTASLVVFWRRAGVIWRAINQGRPTNRFESAGERLSFVLGQVLGHRRLLQKPFSGILHFCIFSGFLVLLLDVLETLGQVVSPSFNLGPILDTVVDVFVVLVIVGLLLALFNRLVLKPKRFHGSNETDAFIILGMIALIMVGIIIRDAYYPLAAREVLGVAHPATQGHFLGYILAGLLAVPGWSSPTAAAVGYAVGYLLDIGVIMVFFAYLPYSKHFHVFTAVPNIYLHKTRPLGELLPEPPAESMAVKSYSDFTWKDLLDLYTCTECGRCQEACPANASGAPLSPKHVILELRDGLTGKLLETGTGGEDGESRPLAGGVVEAEALWSCTTCGACQEVCPVFIEHGPKIISLRAGLLEEGEAGDAGAQKALVSLDRQGNSFGQPSRRRAQWVKGLDFPVPDARKEAVDVLWFVGDYAAYDPRAQENTRLLARILHRAGVRFGILYEGEVNSGNDCLRMGEYGLFESLAEKNLKALETVEFTRIITADPHSLNALRNEYRKLGFERPVFHYTEFLLELVESGRLELHPLGITATYHDPCYLGRWNRIFDAPRSLLRRCGVEVVEMPRHGRFSFCCGAGGGRIWMSEAGTGERPADQRVKEALGLSGVTHLAVACPKDVVMFAASLSALGEESRLQVTDVAALVEAASRSGEAQTEAN